MHGHRQVFADKAREAKLREVQCGRDFPGISTRVLRTSLRMPCKANQLGAHSVDLAFCMQDGLGVMGWGQGIAWEVKFTDPALQFVMQVSPSIAKLDVTRGCFPAGPGPHQDLAAMLRSMLRQPQQEDPDIVDAHVAQDSAPIDGNAAPP